MKFRNDISFLRAFSIIPVLLYHFKFTLFKGGFIGVDIFFVISGYLMTRIILTSFSKESFKLLDFYGKRVIRILPALLFMLSSFAAIIYFAVPTQLIAYLKSCYSSSLFFSNIYYYLNNGYFDAASQFNFLLHTWSLSVEWQFYMVYPLLLLLLRQVYLSHPKRFNVLFFLLIILSFVIMIIHNKKDNPLSFFMFYTRAWEMMFGGLAFLYEKEAQKIKSKYKNSIAILCILILSVCIFSISSQSVQWPSYLTLLPVISTALILLLNVDLKIFRNKAVAFLGNISYSLYLWHWPLYVLSLYFGLHEQIEYKMIFIGLSFTGSILSYYFIEKKEFSKKVNYVLICTAVIFSGTFSLTKINPQLYFPEALGRLVDISAHYKYSEEAVQQYSMEDKHILHDQSFSSYNKKNLLPSKTKRNIILLGDSHAGMFSRTVRELVNENKENLIQVTGDATFPEPNSDSMYEGPKDLMNYFYSVYYPKNSSDIDLILITANYKDYDELDKKITSVLNYFSKYQAKIVFIGQTMSYDMDFPTSYYLHKENKSAEKAITTNEILKQRLGDRYIDLLGYPIKQIDKGTPYIYDSNHYTYYGTNQYKKLISHYLYKTNPISQ